jgi:hypothetical protein
MNEPCKHERLGDLCHNALVEAQHERDEALATIGRARALLGDTAGPLWSVRGVREADLRTALEATS